MTLSRRVGLCDGHGLRRLEVDRGSPRLGHESLAVEETRVPRVLLHRQRAIQGRRKPERDLDLVRIDERREPAARIASVRRRQRAAEAMGERHLHAVKPTD